MTTDRPTRKRRSTEAARGLLLEAARREFAQHGYTGSRTARIAQESGVSNSVLFSQFGSKANLFVEAAVQPFREWVADWSRARAEMTAHDASDEHLVLHSLGTLYDHLTAHRELVRAYLLGGPDDGGCENGPLEPLLRGTVEIAGEWARSRDLHMTELDLRTRMSIAMVIGIAIFPDWFIPDGTAGRDRLVAELAAVTLRGSMNDRPAPTFDGPAPR